MMKSFLTLTTIVLMAALAPSVRAGTILIEPGTDAIQTAIDGASDGDTLIVELGTYPENIDFKGKDIMLRSTLPADPGVVDSTIIDGQELGPVVQFSGAESSDCVLSGFTLINGKASNGGGIRGSVEDDGDGAHATITYCRVLSNGADTDDGAGGGIFNCDGIVRHNTLSGNTAWNGGGFSECGGLIDGNIIRDNTTFNGAGACNSDAVIQNNIFMFNTGTDDGGVLWGCTGIIQNNVFFMNTSDGSGGAMSACGVAGVLPVTIRNNTFYGNSAVADGQSLYDCHGTIVNNIFWTDSASGKAQLTNCSEAMYCCVKDGSGGTGNIFDDPQLVNPVGGAPDFHLRGTSPCRDAGAVIADLRMDFEEHARPTGAAFDIGADEYSETGDGPPAHFPARQILRIETDGHFYAFIFNYETNTFAATLDATGGKPLDYNLPTGQWLGAFLYDYDSGAYVEGLYKYREMWW